MYLVTQTTIQSVRLQFNTSLMSSSRYWQSVLPIQWCYHFQPVPCINVYVLYTNRTLMAPKCISSYRLPMSAFQYFWTSWCVKIMIRLDERRLPSAFNWVGVCGEFSTAVLLFALCVFASVIVWLVCKWEVFVWGVHLHSATGWFRI